MHLRNSHQRSGYGARSIPTVIDMGGLTKAEKERLALLEDSVGVLIGLALGGPVGARMGRHAADAFQLSPVNQYAKDLLFSTLPDRGMDPTVRLPELIGNRDRARMAIDQYRDNAGAKKRKPSAYNRRYGKCFKKLASKYKKKNGSWKKDGFKRCSAAARKCAKK